ncbi:MAG: HD-GYP domain-containing protein [Candidatus Eisenbacteria bacterium]|nr:HD-GYP domain-containing protein [Candidatus Eisenbacteria bacterium]
MSVSRNPGGAFAAFYLLIIGLGFGLLLLATPSLGASFTPILLLWLLLTILTDANPVHLPNGGYITVASTLDYAGILIFGPVATAWVEVLNTLILHGLIQKKPMKKTLFNASVFALTILVAGRVYQMAGGPIGVTPNLVMHGPALLLLGFTYFLVNTSAVSLILALSQGKRLWAIWRVNFRWTASHMVAAVVVGVALAALYHALGVGGVFLFVTPLLLASYAFRLYTEARRDIIDFVGVLSGVIDEVDPYTHRHTQRVAHYAVLLARELDLPEQEVETIEFAALLHDLGKIKKEHRELLLRPSSLTEDERRHMASHAEFGAAMAARLRSLKTTSEIVMAHHEKLDGTGYPRGLAGKEIPMGARIVAVADAFDAMTTDRVYRPAMPLEKALLILREEAGRHFDPAVVSCLERLVHSGDIRPGSTGRRQEPEARLASGTDPAVDPASVQPTLEPIR